MRADIAQDDLAFRAGLDRAYVGRVERGIVNPTVGTLDKLAKALSVHVSELLREPPRNAVFPEPLKGGRPFRTKK